MAAADRPNPSLDRRRSQIATGIPFVDEDVAQPTVVGNCGSVLLVEAPDHPTLVMDAERFDRLAAGSDRPLGSCDGRHGSPPGHHVPLIGMDRRRQSCLPFSSVIGFNAPGDSGLPPGSPGLVV